MTSASTRQEARAKFLREQGWHDARIEPLTPDASFRSYARLRRAGDGCMLMDAPPAHEDLKAYLDITAHLRALGLRVADTLGTDLEAGFALIEDMGDDTFTRLLDAGHDAEPLYLLATDVLKALHAHPKAVEVDVPPYDMAALLREAELFVDWFVPAFRGSEASKTEKQRYMDAWQGALKDVARVRSALVLRDYHVDNLMITGGTEDIRHCGLLDYQDALLGSPAYDLVSLVEDARRDVPSGLRAAVMERYTAGMQDNEVTALERDMALLGAQRHAKVAGIFVRLSKRDGKPIYLGHIPRVLRLLSSALKTPELAGVRESIEAMVPDYESARF
ncbi:aminoglycoside phosphotransferase family protein [Kordiimonas lipolytica]|uniref:Aminoglycoside phosphotransferase family protein n=1 Tax=Kordiimonas lipolytica TaxID=1662421 RepID=A0ABV8UB30_9PROT|nr:phosphotransferase [Kordiimonas lipolytica]